MPKSGLYNKETIKEKLETGCIFIDHNGFETMSDKKYFFKVQFTYQ